MRRGHWLTASSDVLRSKGSYLTSRSNRYRLIRARLTKHDVYEARLKVLAGLHPKPVELIKQADVAKDSVERRQLERGAVAAYFAELAHYWSEDEVLAWQRNNPVETK